MLVWRGIWPDLRREGGASGAIARARMQPMRALCGNRREAAQMGLCMVEDRQLLLIVQTRTNSGCVSEQARRYECGIGPLGTWDVARRQ